MWKHDSKRYERRPLNGWLTIQTILSLGNKYVPDLTFAKSVVVQNTTKTAGDDDPPAGDLSLSLEVTILEGLSSI